MKVRSHRHEEVFPGIPKEVFALLHTPSAVRSWWGASRAVIVPEASGFWAAAWGGSEDRPNSVTVADIAEFDPLRRPVRRDNCYWARTGPLPFEGDFLTTFEVVPAPHGALLRVTQEGFPISPEGDESLAACTKGWRDTFAAVRTYLEGTE